MLFLITIYKTYQAIYQYVSIVIKVQYLILEGFRSLLLLSRTKGADEKILQGLPTVIREEAGSRAAKCIRGNNRFALNPLVVFP